jgi:hypothetical protein
VTPEALSLLEATHTERLRWFHDRAGQVVGWPERLTNGLYLVTRPKGIFKPSDLSYAVSVRILLESPYADGEIHQRPEDGTWHFAYHQENPDPARRDSEYTNKALMRCLRDQVPVGVLRQRETRPVKPVRYDVMGLAVPVHWEDGYFYFEGYGPDGPRVTTSKDQEHMREVIRAAKGAWEARVAAQFGRRDLPGAGPTSDYSDADAQAAVPQSGRVGGHEVRDIDMSDAVSIRPGVAMLGLFPHMKYQPWYALGNSSTTASRATSPTVTGFATPIPTTACALRSRSTRTREERSSSATTRPASPTATGTAPSWSRSRRPTRAG